VRARVDKTLSGDRAAVPPQFIDGSITRQMADMIRAFRISQLVGTIAQLGIPDQIASGALTAGELASLIGCHAGATHRLMRAASGLGLVALGPDTRFTLTALGQSLRSDVPGSVRDVAIALTSPGHWLPWGRLTEAVRTGRRQSAETLGAELFAYYANNPAEGHAFTGAMSVSSMEVADEVARVLDTSSTKLAVDVGGASGTLISALLKKNPALTGAILERAEVVPRAQAALAKRGLASRCHVFEGNFFLSIR
jgi:O-methyltransferase domain